MISLIPPLYRWLGGIAALTLVLLSAYGLGHWDGAKAVQARWDVDAAAKHRLALQASLEARATESRYNAQLKEAQDAQTVAQAALRDQSDAARTTERSLRNTLAAVRGELSAATAEASRRTAAAAIDVFGECTGEYRALAEEAGRGAIAARTLSDAWPTKEGE